MKKKAKILVNFGSQLYLIRYAYIPDQVNFLGVQLVIRNILRFFPYRILLNPTSTGVVVVVCGTVPTLNISAPGRARGLNF